MERFPCEIWCIIFRFGDLMDLACFHTISREMTALAHAERAHVLEQNIMSAYNRLFKEYAHVKVLRILCLLGCYAYNRQCLHVDLYIRYGRFLQDLSRNLQEICMASILERYRLPPPLRRTPYIQSE
jgi:hypothetical protein